MQITIYIEALHWEAVCSQSVGEDFNGTALRVCRSEQMHKKGSG